MAALKATCSINLRKRDEANVPENQKSKSATRAADGTTQGLGVVAAIFNQPARQKHVPGKSEAAPVEAIREVMDQLGPSRSGLGEGPRSRILKASRTGMRIDLAQNATRAIDGTF
jgi:hypothetical protein